MRIILFAPFLLFIACSNEKLEYCSETYNYSFIDKRSNDTIKCIQVNSNLIDEKNTISIKNVKSELVDSTKALVKIYGHIISIQEGFIQFSIPNETDTIYAKLTFDSDFSKSFIGRKSIFSGVIQVHPKLDFKIQSFLVLGVSKRME